MRNELLAEELEKGGLRFLVGRGKVAVTLKSRFSQEFICTQGFVISQGFLHGKVRD